MGLDAAVPTPVTQPATDARPPSLHKRLTVALAHSTDRARLAEAVADAVATDGASPLLRAEDLWQAAETAALGRADDRRALRARLDAVAARAMHDCDTARHQLEHLQGWRRTITDGADWAAQLHDDLPEHLAAVEAVRTALDERRAEQRSRQQDLERVLEQRKAAAVAIEEADRELGDLAGSGMDESGLRRELEAAGQAVREAEEAHSAARRRLEELQLEATGLGVRREAAEAVPGQGTDDTEAVAAIRAAVTEIQAFSMPGQVDPDAAALAEAWRDLQADLREVAGPDQTATEQELDAARRRVSAAAAALAAMDAAASESALTPAQRQALDDAHAEVLAAEDQITRRRVTNGARKRLDAAHAAEQALLEQHGLSSYLDLVLSGGRSASVDPARPAAEREHFEATLALDALERSTQSSVELRHLRSERARLLGLAADLLGVDPGDHVEALLLAHRPGARDAYEPLAQALEAVGIRPVGVSLEDAALAFLESHPLPEATEPAAELHPEARAIELAAIDARAAALEGELSNAVAAVDRTGDELQRAQRAVDAFEGELTVRAGEDVQRMKRFAAAEQLRAQIDAVAATLRRAEVTAKEELEASGDAVAAAESTFEKAAGDVSDLARQARKLAEELPIDKRPEGDPLRTLPLLAERLRAHAEVLQPEIDKAEAAVAAGAEQLEEAMAACRVASAHGDGPHPEDLAEGLAALLAPTDTSALLVLDEPFAGIDEALRNDLLEVVRTSSAHRQVALLTEDPDVLGWAIELPVEEAMAVPADSLLTRLRRANHGLNSAVSEADATAPADPAPTGTTIPAGPPAVDITTPTTIDPDQEPAPSAPRWAGQR